MKKRMPMKKKKRWQGFYKKKQRYSKNIYFQNIHFKIIKKKTHLFGVLINLFLVFDEHYQMLNENNYLGVLILLQAKENYFFT